jgi:hypothetical protein
VVVVAGNLRIAGIFFTVVLCLISLNAWWWWHQANIQTRLILLEARESLELDASRSLAQGSTKSQVQQFLVARKMVYAEQGASDKSELKNSAGSQIEARTTQEIEAPLATCFILARYNFDASGILQDSSYKTTCKGLW